MRIVFVDGYNVINCWPMLRNMKDSSFEGARQKLIDILQNYATYKEYRVIIVFDGHLVKGSLEKKEELINISVVYTKEGETADSYIERSVNDIGRKLEVCVVTSDSLEQQVTFQRGAIRMSSNEFYFEVLDVESRIKVRTEKRHSQKRNILEDRIEKDVLEKLEKIRRNR